MIGDIVGSRFEFHNRLSKEFEFFSDKCFFTDDSIMTLAIAKAIMICNGNWEDLGQQTIRCMQGIGRKYPDCGYGGRFCNWMFASDPQPYYSFGNGAAMRVSSCGFAARTEGEAKLLSRKVTEISHDHPEGIKGAEATTIAIFMARNGATKKEIGKRMKVYYDLDFTLDGIRHNYEYNEICQQTVPQAIVAFLESASFEDTIRGAISIGGDSDTLAAIAGGIAEAYYSVPDDLKEKALTYFDSELKEIYSEWERYIRKTQ
jgi:type I restriction enzyme M protein